MKQNELLKCSHAELGGYLIGLWKATNRNIDAVVLHHHQVLMILKILKVTNDYMKLEKGLDAKQTYKTILHQKARYDSKFFEALTRGPLKWS